MEYEVTVTITLVYTTKVSSQEAALLEAQQMDDAEIWGVANSINHDYKVVEVQ